MTAQQDGGGSASRSVATSCWGRRQRITQPKALNLLMKLPEATLSLILLFSQGTGQQLPSDSLVVWVVGGRLGWVRAAGLTSLWTLKTLAAKAPCAQPVLALSHPGSRAPGLRDNLSSAKGGGTGSWKDPVRLPGLWATDPSQQPWGSGLGQASFAASHPGNVSSRVS